MTIIVYGLILNILHVLVKNYFMLNFQIKQKLYQLYVTLISHISILINNIDQ